MRPELNPIPVAWLDKIPRNDVWTTAVNILESRSGLLLLPAGRRKSELIDRLGVVLDQVLLARVLPFDRPAAECAAEISSTRIGMGTNKGTRDTQIAGIAIAHGATLATRNIKDFADLDIRLVNPWTD